MAFLTNRITHLVVIFLISGNINIFSQEYFIFQNYYLNPSLINPAIAGTENYPSADLSVRKQWVGIPDAPTTYLMAVNFKIGRYDFYDPKKFINKGPLKFTDRIGLGVSIFRDINGPLSYTGGILSYSYHVPVNKDSKLSFGMSAIFNYYSFNSSILKPDQSNDPYLLNGNDNGFNTNFNFGIYFYNEVYFIGFSADNILPGIQEANDQNMEQPSLYLMGGYKFLKNSRNLILEPSLTLKKLANTNIYVDIHAKLYILKSHWIAVSYSTDNRINFRFGVLLYKKLYAGYNYEYTLTDIGSYNFGSHEIHLGINLGLRGIEGIR
jgi:type IX secretion system PorP/SprF family membrane protein